MSDQTPPLRNDGDGSADRRTDHSPDFSSPFAMATRESLLPTRLAFETPGRQQVPAPAPKSSRRVVKVKSRYLTSITKQRPGEMGEQNPRRQSVAKTPQIASRPSSVKKLRSSSAATYKPGPKTPSAAKSMGVKTPSVSKSKTPFAVKTKTPSVSVPKKTPGRSSAADLRLLSSGSTSSNVASHSTDKTNSRPYLIRKAQGLSNTILQAGYARALLEQNSRKSEKQFMDWARKVASAIDALTKSAANIRLALQKKQVYKAVDEILAFDDVLCDSLSRLKVTNEQNSRLAAALEKCSLQLPASGVSWDSDVKLLTSLQACRHAVEQAAPRISDSAAGFTGLAQVLDELSKVILEQEAGLVKAESLASTLASLENTERSLRIHLMQLAEASDV